VDSQEMQRQSVLAAGLHAIDVDAMILGGIVATSMNESAPHVVTEAAAFWSPKVAGLEPRAEHSKPIPGSLLRHYPTCPYSLDVFRHPKDG
jgi:hypothetical protein